MEKPGPWLYRAAQGHLRQQHSTADASGPRAQPPTTPASTTIPMT